MRGRRVATLTWRGSTGVRRWSSVSGDIYAQKLQHHLLDGEFHAAMDMYKLTTKETPKSLQNVMALIEQLAAKKDAARVQRSTIAFFLKQQRILASPLLAAYNDLDVVPPPPAFREMLLFLVQASDLPRIVQALHMALEHRIPIAADAFHQCFLLGRDEEYEDSAVEGTTADEFDCRIFTSLFSRCCAAGLVAPMSYPGLGDSILSACFRRGILDEAVACIAQLPPGSVQDVVHQLMLAIVQTSSDFTASKVAATRQALYESLVSFYKYHDRTYAWHIFQLMEQHHLTLPPRLLNDIALSVLKQGARKDAVDAVVDHAIRHHIHVDDSVYSAGLDQPNAPLDWAHRLLEANQHGMPLSSALLADAVVKALCHEGYDLASELYAILLCQNEGQPAHSDHAMLHLTMQTLDEARRRNGEDTASQQLIVDALLRRQEERVMELFHLLAVPERASRIDSPLLEALLPAAPTAKDAAALFRHSNTHNIPLSAAAVEACLTKFAAQAHQDLIACVRGVVTANLVPTTVALQTLLDAAVRGIDSAIPLEARDCGGTVAPDGAAPPL
ncbi:hypothetical protein H310_05274 [Aphanomyces invadans]|uniref:Uncharacterized protein n=1 Tax=Aphanomyces invadans TaxID=157072 RepID=A0A024UAX4_9STRA|nr:hypothetical protein H310_05274 [Aphanomyces invadans]ETW02783.1 hypothetical protein H310_05274 [Aphanomyces invadans]|eukprot:XP_008868167.1 hypothetical protein H310_05274 [Aphanomyces invadans]